MTTTGDRSLDDVVQSSFAHVLVVVSPTEEECTLTAAAEIARRAGARLTLLGVLEPPADLEPLARATGLPKADVIERLKTGLLDAISGRSKAALPDLDVVIDIAVGKPFIEIIRYVDTHGVDLIVKTADDGLGIKSYLFSSTDQHLLRKCPCPVWLRVPGAPRSVSSILAAIDIDAEANAEQETLADLNRSILDTAGRLAVGTSAVIHVLHVWDAPGEGLVRLWSGAADGREAAVTYVRDVRAAHGGALDRSIAAVFGRAPLDKVEVRPVLRRGAPRQVVAEQVRKLSVDVLVMGTIARTGVPGFFIGNTAEDILNTVDCSVVTVKPHSYVSPVLALSGVDSRSR